VDRGFDPRGLLTMRVPQPPKTTFASQATLLDRLQTRLQALPGVTDVAVGNALPFVTPGFYRGMNLALPRDPSTSVEVQTTMRAVSPEYFRAMRLRIIEGRPIERSDGVTSSPVVVVNRTFAAKYLGDDPIGQHLDFNMGDKPWEIVGVVEDMQGSNPVNPRPVRWCLIRRRPRRFAHGNGVLRRTSSRRSKPGDPASLATDARTIIRAKIHASGRSVMTMTSGVASLAGPRSYAVFLVGPRCARSQLPASDSSACCPTSLRSGPARSECEPHSVRGAGTWSSSWRGRR
jgi:hypothetical protein